MGGIVLTIVCSADHYNDELVRRIREWLSRKTDPNVADMINRTVREQGLESAVSQVKADPSASILLTIGINNREIDAFLDKLDTSKDEIIVCKPDDDRPVSSASCSPREITRVNAGANDPIPFLRKACIRLSLRPRVTIVNLQSEEELDAYFSLRHQVWTELNYLAPAQASGKTRWEVDYTDRVSFPIGVLLSDGNGEMVGCARLVMGYGHENHMTIPVIMKLIKERDDAKLRDNFEYPEHLTHPFDLLKSFREFNAYYQRLVKNNVPKAEISRVIVLPEWRRKFVGEMLVDTLVAKARMMGIRVLFLACLERHAPFYERCGFDVIQGLSCESFAGVNVPAVAMHLRDEETD